MPTKIDIPLFLHAAEQEIVIDVRSEGEYSHGHIPGAINIPLLNNENRKIVGTIYKEKGHEAAVMAGYELVGGSFGKLYQNYRDVSGDKKVIFYCWRGGMRSQISATIYEWGGQTSKLIKGGYKAYRNYALNSFNEAKKIVILSGFTGVGKTDILQILMQHGEQILDIESLANHKGSALGGLGMPPQDTQEMFENKMFEKWYKFNSNNIVFVENESRRIGVNVLPQGVWNQMVSAPIIDIVLDKAERLDRILLEYGSLPKEDLKLGTQKIAKRLGGLNLKLAIEALEAGNISGWASILMDYYDRTYLHGRDQRNAALNELVWDWNDFEKSLQKLLNKI